MLEALHPNRIDLGLGRAPGTDMRAALALRSTSPELFEEQFEQLRGHLGAGYAGMRAVAGEHTAPELWMLGSTDGGARIAARLGLPFVFAHHFHPHFTEPALDLYRGLFEPSERLDAPRTIVAAGIVVGEDDEDAARRALPGGVAMLRARADPQRRGRRGAAAAAEPGRARRRRRGGAARDRRRAGVRARAAGRPCRAHGDRRADARLAGHRPRAAHPRPGAGRGGLRACAAAGA